VTVVPYSDRSSWAKGLLATVAFLAAMFGGLVLYLAWLFRGW
jgi:hypothetical protein